MHVIKWFLEILDQYLFSHGSKLNGLLGKMVFKLMGQVCFVYRALFILTEPLKNQVQKIFDQTIVTVLLSFQWNR